MERWICVEQTGYLTPLTHKPSSPVTYYLSLGDESITLNEMLGETIQLTFLGEKSCCFCGRKIKKTYNNGYCYPCFTSLAQNDLCIVKPELCHYHSGTCRDQAFGEKHCHQAHYVYLALSSDVKVGITRKENAINRWINQGAIAAVPIMEVPYRKVAGEVEIHLAKYLKDKTNWRKMLKNEYTETDLLQVKQQMIPLIPEEYQSYLLPDQSIQQFTYPSLQVPSKIVPLNLDKKPSIKGELIGIKAQYLLFKNGEVVNIRKHTGYKVSLHY
jgi:hypothetical protein